MAPVWLSQLFVVHWDWALVAWWHVIVPIVVRPGDRSLKVIVTAAIRVWHKSDKGTNDHKSYVSAESKQWAAPSVSDAPALLRVRGLTLEMTLAAEATRQKVPC